MPAREVVRLRVDLLDEDPDQPRSRFDDEALAGLAASIEAVGQLQPILARSNPGVRGRHFIVEGHRRVRVFRATGRLEIDALLVDDTLRPGDVRLTQLVLGVQHEKLGPIELARGIRAELDTGKRTQAHIAKVLGLTEARVSRSLLLLSLTPALQRRVEEGTLPESTAAQIARAGDTATQERLAAQVAEKGLTRDAVAAQLKRTRRPKETARQAVARLVACLSGGRTVTLAGPGLDTLDSAIEWAEEFLSQARRARPKGIGVSTFARLLRDQAALGAKAGKEEL